MNDSKKRLNFNSKSKEQLELENLLNQIPILQSANEALISEIVKLKEDLYQQKIMLSSLIEIVITKQLATEDEYVEQTSKIKDIYDFTQKLEFEKKRQEYSLKILQNAPCAHS